MALPTLAPRRSMDCASSSACRVRRLALHCTAPSRRTNWRLRPQCWRLAHQHVLELPRIALVDVLREEARAAHERRPIRIDADDRPEIGRLNLKTPPKIQFVGLDNSGL